MTEDSSALSTGFQISDEPVIRSQPREETPAASVRDWSSGPDDDSLYILARDPASLFVYWTLDWVPRFAAAGLGEAQRQVYLRVLRADETEETTLTIDPLVGFAFVKVNSPETEYTCEIGCLDGETWTPVARSSSVQTPAATLSGDLSADFATLPFHLSFQRLVDLFHAAPGGNGAVASAVADWQAKARALQATLSPSDWSELVENASSQSGSECAGLGLPGAQPGEMATLLRTVKEDVTRVLPSPEKLEEWRRLGERFGGASWGGASSPGAGERWGGSSSSFGGSSR